MVREHTLELLKILYQLQDMTVVKTRGYVPMYSVKGKHFKKLPSKFDIFQSNLNKSNAQLKITDKANQSQTTSNISLSPFFWQKLFETWSDLTSRILSQCTIS